MRGFDRRVLLVLLILLHTPAKALQEVEQVMLLRAQRHMPAGSTASFGQDSTTRCAMGRAMVWLR